MCGLIAYLGTPKEKSSRVHNAVTTQYEEQHARGQKGFGIISIKNGAAVTHRACEPVKFFFDIHETKGPFLAVHHRFPTSTKNSIRQTHPIIVPMKGGRALLVMHNGIISNAHTLFKKHTEELGYAYTTYTPIVTSTNYLLPAFNDSEAFAWELARFIDGDETRINALGTAAFLALEVDKKNHPLAFHFGRNEGNELLVKKQKNGGILIASEADGDLINPFELNSLAYSHGVFGPASRRALPFIDPPPVPVTIGFRSKWGYTDPPAKSPSFNRDVDTLWGEKKPVAPPRPENIPEYRTSAFDIDPYGPAMTSYQEMADEEGDMIEERVAESLATALEDFRNGELVKHTVTKITGEIAKILTTLINLQDELEARAALGATKNTSQCAKLAKKEGYKKHTPAAADNDPSLLHG